MLGNDYNPVVTKEELVDIVYKNFRNLIIKTDLENIIDSISKSENENNKIFCVTKEEIMLYSLRNKSFNRDESLNNVIFSKEFKEVYYFKIEDNKYIFFYLKPNVEKDLGCLYQIEYILKNKLNNGINDNELKHYHAQFLEEINKFRKEETIDSKFKEYDYIQVICENGYYNEIGIKDVEKCRTFLNYHKEHQFLTLEEQIALKLIILLGVKNIYLNNSGYYQAQYSLELNQIKEEINNFIFFIEENMKNVKEEIKYSFDYRYSLNLKEYCSRIFVYLKEGYSVWNRDISLYEKVDNEFISFLRYISFDYYVTNKNFEEAHKIFEKELPLFKFLKSSSYKSEHMIIELIYLILEKNYKYNEDEKNKQINLLADILSYKDNTNLYNYFSKLSFTTSIKRNIKEVLKFYIDCYYYFVHFKDEENANKLYDFLTYFKEGYGIEDFILRCRYIKMAEILNDNKLENINKIEEVDIAINKLENLIDNMKLINQFDIEDVENNYDNIEFSNFKKENREYIKKCIATGDKIMNTFNTMDMDFSNVVVEWSKAVETAIDEKLFSNEVISYDDKHIIESSFTKIDFKGNELHFRLKKQKDITVGIFNDMENYTNGKHNLTKYLYDNYFAQKYTLEEKIYVKLCKYLKTISTPRNESAHKGKTIDKSVAMDCKEKILASEKILEILSKLEKRKHTNGK